MRKPFRAVFEAANPTMSVDCAKGRDGEIHVVRGSGESLTVEGKNCGVGWTGPFIKPSLSTASSDEGPGPYVWTVSPKAKAAVFGNAEAGVLYVETGDPDAKSGVAFSLVIKG
jgi:hypothetical protein